MAIGTFFFRFCAAKVRSLTQYFIFFFSLILHVWKEQLFLLCSVISSDRAACGYDSPSLVLLSPGGTAVRSSKAHFRSSKLCAASGFGSCSLRLRVTRIQQNSLGLDRAFPSPDFVEPQTVDFWENQASLSGCHPCGSSSAAGKSSRASRGLWMGLT